MRAAPFDSHVDHWENRDVPDSMVRLYGARQNNLRNIDVSFPHASLTVVTGVSGSGKSSLAFDTLYAEGQRRYVECVSTYAKQFLDRLPRPDYDRVEGLAPAVAIRQGAAAQTGRSTVGTVTELADYMRLLLARVGETWCSKCDAAVPRHSVDSVLEEILAVPNVAVTISTRFEAREGETAEQLAARALSRGFLRARRVGSTEWVRLDEPLAGLISPGDGAGNGAGTAVGATSTAGAAGKAAKAAPKKRGRPKRVLDVGLTTATALGPTADPIEVFVDRLAATPDNRMRLRESLELAWRESLGSVQVARESGETLTFFDGRTCARCGKSFPEPRPQLFSFNSPYGACIDCHGFGNILTFTVERVVPDPNKSILNGALDPWANSWRAHFMPKLVALGKEHGIPLGVPFRTLTKEQQKMVLHGTTGFRGVFPFLERLKEKAYKSSNRFLVKRYQESVLCQTCGGMRLKPEALDVRIGTRNVAEISAMTVGQLRHFMATLKLDPVRSAVAAPILAELRGRLEYLGETGLDYLTLDRPSKTLSGGEAQRIDLANALGGSLSHTLYVLDEPTVGLHPRDTERLIRVLKRLRERGNTLLVVEHDPDVIAAADWILEMGPGAGHRGGNLLYGGPSQTWPAREETTQPVEIAAEPKPFYKTRPTEWIEIVGAREHNLKDIDVRFPLGALTGVCGVSGSGKSTLVEEILYRVAARKLGENVPAPGAHKITRGLGQFDRVTLVDQSPVARSTRSNPSTYVKAFDRIRERYARAPLARQRKYTPGTFSFNVKGGRCEACEGAGVTQVEMFFLADLWVPCETCSSRRYRPEILQVKVHGLAIDELLGKTVEETLALFPGEPEIQEPLWILERVGLGYLKLGQSLSTLSGGETQRLKLARELSGGNAPESLYILDEPTVGLHRKDVATLLKVLRELTRRGATVIAVEHNLDFLSTCDYLVELGPEGGDGGGKLIAEGTPAELSKVEGSPTASYLRRIAACA